MKKIILVVLLALSLQAGSVMCEDSIARYKKFYQEFQFALERTDYFVMGIKNDMALLYIEKSLVERGPLWEHRETAEKLRANCIKMSNALGGR